MKDFYFAYGSNLHREQMKCRCPGSEPYAAATLENYRLAERLYADVEPAEGECVHGALYRIGGDDLAGLDHYEGYPSFYTRCRVPVKLENGETVSAWVYVMTPACRDGRRGEPYSQRYRAVCSEGAQSWGIPDAFAVRLT